MGRGMTNRTIRNAEIGAAMRENRAFILRHDYRAMLPYMLFAFQIWEREGFYTTGD